MKLKRTTAAGIPLLFNKDFFLRFIDEGNFQGANGDAKMSDYLSFIESVTFLAHDEYCKAENIENKYRREMMAIDILELKAFDFSVIHHEYDSFVTSNLQHLDEVLFHHFVLIGSKDLGSVAKFIQMFRSKTH